MPTTAFALSVHGKRSQDDISAPVVAIQGGGMSVEVFYELGTMYLKTSGTTKREGEVIERSTTTTLTRSERKRLIAALAAHGPDTWGEIGSQRYNRDGDKLTIGNAHVDVHVHSEFAAEAVALLSDVRSW